jgi:preprotein translocase subunit SecD
LTNKDVAVAKAGRSVQGDWVVNVELTKAGSRLWDRATQLYFHQYLAVVIDGKVLMDSLIQPQSPYWTSFNGQLQISGPRTRLEAKAIASGISP